MSILHSKNRRPEPLQPADYDHEIRLEDHEGLERARSQSATDEHRALSPSAASDSSSRRHSDVPLHKAHSLRRALTRKKYAKYQDRHENDTQPQSHAEVANGGQGSAPSDSVGQASPNEENRGRMKSEPESAIDILIENERGLFLCGIPFFSSKALGNLDPAPWTTVYGTKSFTDTTNHQPADPSWEWAWPEWRIVHDSHCDEEGWGYSFAFSKLFRWHGPTWWNSYVRKRGWYIKRVKKPEFHNVHESHMLTEDYFTIHAAQARSHSRASNTEGISENRRSMARQEMEEDVEKEDIRDISSLLKALRRSRIDREKMEAVEYFIQNGGDELYYLHTHMHEIMKLFIFQASRRLLLAHLIKMLEDVSAKESADPGIASEEKEAEGVKKERRTKDLQAAIKAADEEVKKLEYWSDIKEMAGQGEIHALDEEQGWDPSWKGLDESGPRNVAWDKNLAGIEDCEGRHSSASDGDADGAAKGKEKAKE